MARTKGKGKKGARAGMPAADSIVGVDEMVRGGKVYRIIKTNEVDAYEEPPKARSGRGSKR